MCSRISCAAKRSVATPARAPGTRLAAIEMPIPLPQTTTPRSARPGGDGASDGEAEVGVVDGDGGGGAEVEHLVPQLGRAAGEELLQLEARVVGAKSDAHR